MLAGMPMLYLLLMALAALTGRRGLWKAAYFSSSSALIAAVCGVPVYLSCAVWFAVFVLLYGFLRRL